MPDQTQLTELQNQLAIMQAQIDALEKDKATWQEDKVEMQTRIDHLLAHLTLSKSQKYGKKSEKTPRGTFNEAEQHKTTEPPKHFEREVIEHSLIELDCPCCGEKMHQCGSEDSEQIKIIPVKITVLKHKQFKYACRECEHEQLSNKIITAPKPKQPIPGSIASPEALAAVVTAKYCDALPLYRLVDIFKRGGLALSRGTLANWCIKSGNLIKPLVKAMQRHLLSEHSLCADETRVQVLDEGKNPSSQSQMWVYRSFDGKGIVMRPESLRECTKKKAQNAKKLNSRLSAGEKKDRKRMAQVASVYTVIPHIRTAESVMKSEDEENKVKTLRVPARNKRVWASVKREAISVIEEAFTEALQRDPEQKRQ
jgi:transposase